MVAVKPANSAGSTPMPCSHVSWAWVAAPSLLSMGTGAALVVSLSTVERANRRCCRKCHQLT